MAGRVPGRAGAGGGRPRRRRPLRRARLPGDRAHRPRRDRAGVPPGVPAGRRGRGPPPGRLPPGGLLDRRAVRPAPRPADGGPGRRAEPRRDAPRHRPGRWLRRSPPARRPPVAAAARRPAGRGRGSHRRRRRPVRGGCRVAGPGPRGDGRPPRHRPRGRGPHADRRGPPRRGPSPRRGGGARPAGGLAGRRAGGGPAPLGLGPTPSGPTLTPREREVARLLAEGLSNSQLAERLYISPRTAAVHVSNILSKLDAVPHGGGRLGRARRAGVRRGCQRPDRRPQLVAALVHHVDRLGGGQGRARAAPRLLEGRPTLVSRAPPSRPRGCGRCRPARRGAARRGRRPPGWRPRPEVVDAGCRPTRPGAGRACRRHRPDRAMPGRGATPPRRRGGRCGGRAWPSRPAAGGGQAAAISDGHEGDGRRARRGPSRRPSRPRRRPRSWWWPRWWPSWWAGRGGGAVVGAGRPGGGRRGRSRVARSWWGPARRRHRRPPGGDANAGRRAGEAGGGQPWTDRTNGRPAPPSPAGGRRRCRRGRRPPTGTGPAEAPADAAARSRPARMPSSSHGGAALPTSTRVPTTLRIIWWQKALASISKRRMPSPTSDQAARRTVRTSDASLPSRSLGRRQKAEKSCSPISGSHPRRSRSRSSGSSTCQAVPARTGRAPAG